MAIGTPKRNRTSYTQSKYDQRKSSERRSSVQYSLLGLGIGFDDLDNEDEDCNSVMSTPSFASPATPRPTKEEQEDKPKTPLSCPARTSHVLAARKSSKRRSSVSKRRSSANEIAETLDNLKFLLTEDDSPVTVTFEATRRLKADDESAVFFLEDLPIPSDDASTKTLPSPSTPELKKKKKSSKDVSSPSTPKKLKKKKSPKDLDKSPKTTKEECNTKMPKKSKTPKSPKTPKKSKSSEKKSKKMAKTLDKESQHTLPTVASENSLHSTLQISRLSDDHGTAIINQQFRTSFKIPTTRIFGSLHDSFCLDEDNDDDMPFRSSSVKFATSYSEMTIVADLSENVHLDDLYYRDEELAEFRHDAFLEECGLDKDEFCY